MAADGVGEQGAQGAVVDGTGAGLSAVGTLEQTQIGLEHAATQRLVGQQAEEVLSVDVFQFGIVVLPRQPIVDLVVEAVHVEMIGGDVAGITLVLAVHANVLGISGVPGGVLVQARGHDIQVLHFPGREHRAIEHRRQQAAIVVLEQRHIRQQRAVLQYALRHAHLGGQAELGVFVRRTPRVTAAGRQQAAVTAVGTGVELEPRHAQCIDTKTQCAFGEPRLQIENETLGRLFAFGRALLVGGVAVTEVAVEIHRA
ncbi:hypothetical protein D3C76_429700 [compost metagenome]